MNHGSFLELQTDTFTKQLPNMTLTGLDIKKKTAPNTVLDSARFGLTSWDPNTRQGNLNNIDLSKFATSIEISQELIDAQQKCQTTKLDDLINTYNPADKIRCGWIYEKGTPGDQPKLSQGALGSRNGPAGFFQNPKGTWFWNLEDAKKQILADRCAALTDCSKVGAANYANCAFSKTRGMGIPVDNKGRIMYPRDERLTAPRSSLVMSPDKCAPPPTPGSPADQYARSRDVCIPLEDGKLSRDCMLQQITAAGCKMDGSLYNSLLTQAQPNNYAAGIMQTTMYKRYQQLANTPLLEGAIKDGSTTSELALANFKSLAQEAAKVEERVENYAARDMCLKQGTFDKFDFCTELQDSSSPPFALECLQKEFRKAGGQPAGTLYPSAQNRIKVWDPVGSWRNVKEFIQDLAVKTRSKDEKVQRKALTEFMGIQREQYPWGQIEAIPGCEVLWFNRGTGTFLGRRMAAGNGAFPDISTGGAVEGTGLGDYVQFYTVTNLRPPTKANIRLEMETDDGIGYVLNQMIQGDTSRGEYSANSGRFVANWDQPPTKHTTNTCWNLRAKGPNYVMGFWQETGGFAHHKIFYYNCDQPGERQMIPSSWFTLVQEPDAPMLSYQGLKNREGQLGFNDRRFPSIIGMNFGGKVDISENSGGIPNLPCVVKLKSGSGSGAGVTGKSLAINSWRTITCAFTVNSNSKGWLFYMGPLGVQVNGNQLFFYWAGSTLNVQENLGGIVADGTTPHLLVINMRSDFNGKYPNRFTVGVATMDDWKSGRVSFSPGQSQVKSYTTNGNQPLYAPGDAFALAVGSPSGSADVAIGWIRFFDYELDTSDIIRDCNNAWKMMFMSDYAGLDIVSNPCTLGQINPQNKMRYYSRAECDIIGGTWHANGECTKPQGGSYTWDCRSP